MGELRSNVHHYVDQREVLQAPAPNSKAELQALGLKAAADAEARGAEAPDDAQLHLMLSWRKH